ncbi:MAG: hypothetical protein ABL897_02460 [Hyphomicrobium sp.]
MVTAAKKPPAAAKKAKPAQAAAQSTATKTAKPAAKAEAKPAAKASAKPAAKAASKASSKAAPKSKAKKAAAPPPEPVVYVSDYSVGHKVTHASFGDGKVTAVTGEQLTIQFKVGEKVILDGFVKPGAKG